MGVYDFQIGEQVARVGNAILPIEVDVLTHGGEVLILEYLPSWEPCGCGAFHVQHDQHGEPIRLLSVIKVVDPRSIHHSEMDYVAGEMVHVSAIEQVCQEHGEELVLAVPSYIGTVDLKQTPTFGYMDYSYWSENLRFFRFWNGLPITEANREQVKILIEAVERRVLLSHWEELLYIGEMGQDGNENCDPDLLWAYFFAPETIEEDDIDHVLETVDSFNDEETARQTAISYMERRDEGYFGRLEGDRIVVRALEFEPMETYLVGRPDVLDLWNTLLYRSSLAHIRYCNSTPSPDYTDLKESAL